MSAANETISANIQAPASGDFGDGRGAVAAPLATQRLAGVGAAESSNATAMRAGAYATIVVGLFAVRATFRQATGVGAAVATTDLILAANKEYRWFVQDNTKFVYVEAADGVATYEAWVWQSSQ